MTDTITNARICIECGIPSYWHATAYERKGDPDACNVLRSAVVGYSPHTPHGPTPYAVDSDLANDLYPIFVALVDWSRKAGRTEVNAVHAAAGAMREIGARESLIAGLRRRYAAGTRATADLHREGKLTGDRAFSLGDGQ